MNKDYLRGNASNSIRPQEMFADPKNESRARKNILLPYRLYCRSPKMSDCSAGPNHFGIENSLSHRFIDDLLLDWESVRLLLSAPRSFISSIDRKIAQPPGGKRLGRVDRPKARTAAMARKSAGSPARLQMGWLSSSTLRNFLTGIYLYRL